MAPIERPTEARQGEKGKPVLYVLVASLVLLAIATVGLLSWNRAESPADYAGKSQESAREITTGSVNKAPSSNSGNVPAENPAYPQPSQNKAN
ncbi:hypothetical protein [Methylorubrum salsuginis]|uniref:Uncharacterized protein n=1 Tax=Methylorubrum salsuginis TaxID=414703 RepID=A0A1I4C3F7_9HYPH|nr:hypothetical protein [Methylorubrum salsuginis]SFK74937.1 hypothetical protein SAMN04488125_10410 [Methylorubrum salsuginis]